MTLVTFFICFKYWNFGVKKKENFFCFYLWYTFLMAESLNKSDLIKEGLNAFIFVFGISLQFVSTNCRDELSFLIQQHAQSGLTLCSIGSSIYPLQLFLSPFWKKDWKIRKYMYGEKFLPFIHYFTLSIFWFTEIYHPFKENLQKINLF